MKKIKVLKILPIFGAFAVCLSANIMPKYEAANASDELASAIAGFSQLKVESQLSFNYYFEDYTYEPISHVEDINDDDIYAIAGYIANTGCMTIHNRKNDEGFNDGMEAVPAYSYGGYLRDLDQRISFTKSDDGLSYKMRFSRNSDDYYFATTLNDIGLYNAGGYYRAGSLFETLKFNDASFTEDDLNPDFSINFDEDGYLILKSYSSDAKYAFKDDVLTLALGGPNYKIPFFDMMSDAEKVAYGDTYKVKLFRHVNKPNWGGEHYRKVTNISGLAENKDYVLVTPNGIKYENEYQVELLKDGFMNKSQKLSGVENDGYRDFIKADSNQEILSFTYDNTNKSYRIYAENKGYWKIVEFDDLDVFSLNYDAAEGMGDLFDLNFDSNGNFTIIEHETKSVLVSAKDIGFSDYKADYLFIGEDGPRVFGFDKLHLYKKTNLDTIYKGKPTLCQKLGEDNFAACDVVSVRLQLLVPAEIYNVLKTDWKFYMTYSFDPNPKIIGDEQTIKQELHNDHLDANGNARFSVVFKDIGLKDIDIKITSYCEVSSKVTGEERVTYSRSLNEGNGYSIRDMVNKYLSMKDSQNPDEVAEYERSIKPHKEMLEYIQNY